MAELMNIQQLRTFLAVVERGSFSEAARALGISQPAVTMQMQALESDVGATLVDRRYRRIELTEAGQALLPHARKVLDQIEFARSEIDALSGAVTGRLNIAASTTPGVYVIPRLLGSFVAQNPEVGVTIEVADTASVVRKVEAGEAHLGVTGGTVSSSRVSFDEIGRDELVLICPPNHPLATAQLVELAQLADEPWVFREGGSGTRQVVEQLVAQRGLDPAELRVVVELGTGEAIVSAVEGGLGVSILSRRVAEKALALGSVAQVSVSGLPAARPFFVVSPKTTLTRAASAFGEYLRTAMTQ